MTKMQVAGKVRLGLFGIMLAVAALLAGAANAQTVWRHGTISAKGDSGFLFMAAQRGFAEKLGIKLEIMQFKSDPTMLKAMLAGELDSYEGNPSSPMAAVSRGGDIKIIGCHWPVLTYAMFVKKDGPIKTIADLKGKRIATAGPGALPDIFSRGVLKNAGLKPADAQLVNAGNDADRVGALAVGIVDVAPSSSEFTPDLEKRGLRMLVHAQAATPNFIRFCMYTTGKVLATKRDAAVRFLAAEMRGLDYALKNKDAMVALSREITWAAADDPKPGYIYDEVIRYKSVTPDFGIPLEKLTYMRDLLAEVGFLDKPLDPKAMLDGSLRDEAVRLAAAQR